MTAEAVESMTAPREGEEHRDDDSLSIGREVSRVADQVAQRQDRWYFVCVAQPAAPGQRAVLKQPASSHSFLELQCARKKRTKLRWHEQECSWRLRHGSLLQPW